MLLLRQLVHERMYRDTGAGNRFFSLKEEQELS